MIAIIPARGGSKGLPRKNILSINGKPLIAHTIENALKANCIERVIVSTDDEEIASVSLEFGAEVPFLRPAELATDDASAIDVYLHAVSYLSENMHEKIDNFMVLLPTSPLRDSTDIEKSHDLFVIEKAKTLISITEIAKPIEWYLKKNDNNRIYNAGFATNSLMDNRQKYEKLYVPNGAIYILDYKILKDQRTYYTDNTVPYNMPAERSIDIDSRIDFEIVKHIMENKISVYL